MLKSTQDLLDYLQENGATHSALMDFCKDYMERYCNVLHWSYPISDGKHLGTFLILVKEGVLSLPYDEANEENYEIFCLDDAAMCDEESLKLFMDDWMLFSDDLCNALHAMMCWYSPKEDLKQKTDRAKGGMEP